jgi:hypothetical protein
MMMMMVVVVMMPGSCMPHQGIGCGSVEVVAIAGAIVGCAITSRSAGGHASRTIRVISGRDGRHADDGEGDAAIITKETPTPSPSQSYHYHHGDHANALTASRQHLWKITHRR